MSEQHLRTPLCLEQQTGRYVTAACEGEDLGVGER
jgi:hypothetical protein